jgi:3-methyladenine DNA glycosylase AlkD
MADHVINSWAENVIAEVLDSDKRMYMNWAMAWGIRKAK